MSTLYKWLGRLPLWLLYRFADLLYPLVYYVARYRRKQVRKNLQHAFPELSQSELIKLEKSTYRFMCDNLIEIMKSTSMGSDAFAERIIFTNLEVLTPFIERQQSLLLLAAHQGNWEWFLHALAQKLPCPLDAIYKPLHNQGMDQLMLESRGRHGADPIPFKDAAKAMLRRRREFRCFVMTCDQAPFKKDKRYWGDFFGRPAPFYLGPQKIAELTQYPVLYLSIQRQRRGYYHVRFDVLQEPPHQKGGTEVIDSYIAALEQAIRNEPQTWLWSHNKWKQPRADELAEQSSDE